MRNKTSSVISIVLFVLSSLLAVYAAWAFVQCYRDISEAKAAGQLSVSGNEFSIANFYMTNSIQYIIFAVLLFSAGWLARRPAGLPLTSLLERSSEAGPPAARRAEDEKLDEWFRELGRE